MDTRKMDVTMPLSEFDFLREELGKADKYMKTKTELMELRNKIIYEKNIDVVMELTRIINI